MGGYPFPYLLKRTIPTKTIAKANIEIIPRLNQIVKFVIATPSRNIKLKDSVA